MGRSSILGARPRLAGGLVAALTLLCIALAGSAAVAESVLDRIKADGVIRAGTRANGGAFAHTNDAGGFSGFSVDLLEHIRQVTARETGREIALELVEVTPSDRLMRVAAHDLDIVCGLTTPTWSREREVDFSLPFFRDGTRVMAYRDRASRIANLNGLLIGVVRGTTTVRVVEERLPLATMRLFDSMGEAMTAMKAGDVDGVANIGTALLSEAARARLDRSVVLLPRTSALATEALACVLPQNDSPWRDLVNGALIDLLSGIDRHTSRYEDIYDRWFGLEGVLHYPLDRETRGYLANLSVWAQ